MDKIKQTLLSSITSKAWKKIGVQNHHGICTPLFSLKTEQSCGIGEYFDLLPLIDWCNEIGYDIIQLLPINNAGSDQSPYNAASSCALHLLYLSLHKLPFVSADEELKKKIEECKKLNSSQKILFGEVLSHKMSFLRTYVECYGKKLMVEEKFTDFCNKSSWLEPYALFKSIKDKIGQYNFQTWPNELKTPTKKQYKELLLQYEKEILFYKIMQYLCFEQMKAVKEYAEEKKVFLKGDIPILISPDSADVWHEAELFNLDFCAGAPPDMYNKEGQYWGFPLFNWQVMKKQQFAWWKERLNVADRLYHLYRLDHVLGFFRIWAILTGRPAQEGSFVPSDEKQWGPQGKEILSTLCTFSSMLPIAEDLGSVPDMVRPILEELGICGTKVMRWERQWKTTKDFIPIDQYPPISMTTISTHDSPTLFQWWRDFPDEAKLLAQEKKWDYSPTLTQEQRRSLLYDSHHTTSLFHINPLQEYLALFDELVWPNPDDERINIPGKILSTNWSYRYRISVEQMSCHEGLKSEMRNLIA